MRARILTRRDRGSVSLWLIIFTLTVLVLLGFVVDGGQYMNARERAADIAQQAARAAVDDLQTGSLRNGHFIINTTTACEQAGVDGATSNGPAAALVSEYAGGSATIEPGPDGCAIGGLIENQDNQLLCETNPPPAGGGLGPCVQVTVEITVNPAIPLGPVGTLTTAVPESASLDCGSNVELTGVC
jgi:Putative Flp pilus-assembly TadE/G-like